MADMTETEKIGLELQKRKADQEQENAAEVRTSEVDEDTADDEIDAELKARVHEVLSTGVLTNVDIAQIVLPDPEDENRDPFAKFQFRRRRQNYELLKKSIEELGIIEPIVLKKEIGADGVVRFYILNGHTRISILLELIKEDPTTLIPPFLVVECDNGDATLIATVLNRFGENLDTEDGPFAIIRMFELGGVSQKEIARRMGYSTSYISQIIGGFLNVPSEAREMIESRKWSIEHGIQLARLTKDKKEQLRIFENAKRYGYSAEKVQTTVGDSKERGNYKSKAKKLLTENLGERKSKVVTTGDLTKIHEDTLEEAFPYRRTPEIATKYTREALQDIGFTIVEGDAKIEAKEAPPKKPKMPSNKELMSKDQWDSKTYVCSICGGKTHHLVAENLDFKTESNYPKVDHDSCHYQAEIERLQKKLEKTTIYKRIQEDPEGFTLEQMNIEAQDIYDKELEQRKQAWREKNLPDPQKTVKKGTKVGEPIEEKPKDELQLFEKVRKQNPKLVPMHYWEPIEKFLKQEKGFRGQKEAADTIPVSVQSFYVQLKKVRTAIAKLE